MMNQKLISQSPKVFRHNSIGLGFFFLIGDNNRGDRCSVIDSLTVTHVKSRYKSVISMHICLNRILQFRSIKAISLVLSLTSKPKQRM